MPPKSKAQARFMRAVAGGTIKKPGLSQQEAEEYVSGYPTKELPERAESAKHEKMEKKAAPSGKKMQRGRQMRKGRKSCS